jgi:Putative prokaryotic signal transducing protein
MNQFTQVRSFDNYLLANMLLGRLEAENICCHLKDENTILADPLLSNAIGGIKLMVYTSQLQRALEIIEAVETGAGANIELEDDGVV